MQRAGNVATAATYDLITSGLAFAKRHSQRRQSPRAQRSDLIRTDPRWSPERSSSAGRDASCLQRRDCSDVRPDEIVAPNAQVDEGISVFDHLAYQDPSSDRADDDALDCTRTLYYTSTTKNEAVWAERGVDGWTGAAMKGAHDATAQCTGGVPCFGGLLSL